MNSQALKQIDELLEKRLINLRREIKSDMDALEMNIISIVEKHKADKSDLKNLEKRVDKLETPFHTS